MFDLKNDKNFMAQKSLFDEYYNRVLLPKLKENDKIKNIILDTDYLFFVFAEGKEGEEKPVYIQLDAISGGADKKTGDYVDTDTENI